MATGLQERGVAFHCEGDTLIGVIAHPERPPSRGVLIVVGGPQYRAGSHRQFVLLARYLAEHGIPCMRFDYRGMGDSSGRLRGFEEIDADISAAVECFFNEVPSLKDVVFWGLCDAATASVFYAHRDPRVVGLTLLNPWIRTQAGEARAYLKHYYLRRVVEPAFWKKALSCRFDVKAFVSDLAENVRRLATRQQAGRTERPGGVIDADEVDALPERMATGLERFRGRVLLILSGNDLTAKEFLDTVTANDRWRKLLADSRVERFDLLDANHTFSSRAWRDRVAERTRAWVVAI